MTLRTQRARPGAILIALAAILGTAAPALAGHGDGHRHGRSNDRTERIITHLAHDLIGTALGSRCDAPPRHVVRGGHRDTWVPGRWVWRKQRVCVEPARVDRIWVDPVYRWHVQPCGARVQILVHEGYWRLVDVPARYEVVRKRVWVNGYHRPYDAGGRRYARGGHRGHRGHR